MGESKKKEKQLPFCSRDLPAPGKYTLPSLLGCKNHDPTFYKYPCYSFGIKTPSSRLQKTPGPAEYGLIDATRYGKKTEISAPLGMRIDRKGGFGGPGPGNYSPENHLNATFLRAPAYQFGRKLKSHRSFATPSPNEYRVNFNPVLPRPPAFSMLGKRHRKIEADLPGPAAYLPDHNKIKRRVPAYSLGAKRKGLSKMGTPGPAAYNPNTKWTLPGMPQFTFTSRPNECIKPYITKSDNEL